MALITFSFRQIVGNFTAAAQSTCATLLNFAVGSVLLAIAQATGAVALWLQALCLQVMGLTRAATSTGVDLDTWMAQFGFTRIPGTQSTGQETFGRNNAFLQATVPVGAQVQTPGGTQIFTVIADTTNPNFSPSLNSYVLAVNTFSINIPVQSVGATAAANAQSGTVTQLLSSVPGIDYVTNAVAFTGATDPESDAAFRARFIAYFASLPRATYAALSYAISQIQTPTYYSLTENQNYVSGAFQPGYFYVIIDDGTGTPPGSLLTTVYNTLFYEWRAFTVQYAVYAVSKVVANFSATIVTAQGFDHAAVCAAITTQITTFINTLTLGQTCPYFKLIQICFDAVPGAVTNVQGAILNGGFGDVTATAKQAVRSGTIGIA